MPKPSITLTKAQQARLVQKALELPANQEKITAQAAKRLALRTERVHSAMISQVGQLLVSPSMTEKTKVVRFRTITGFDEGDYPQFEAASFKVAWPDLGPQYWKSKPPATKGVFWRNTGKLARAYNQAVAGRRGKVRAKSLQVRLAKGQRLQTVYELITPSLPWPLSDVLSKPFAYGMARTPAYSFKGYTGGLGVIMFLERPYSARTDMARRRERFRQDAGIEGKGRSGSPAPARPWLRQLASTLRRDMIRTLSSR